MEPIKPVKNYINWNFDNSYSKLPEAFKEIIKPVLVLNPELVILNENLAKELGLDFSKIEKNELSALFAGNILPEGTSSIAQAYPGHQFGHFTMLGDGRRVLIGEHATNQKKRYAIQFKGTGRTTFSRGGADWVAWAPVQRIYVTSEATNSLNVLTT